VEDVVSEAFYLDLVSRAYAADLSETDAVPDVLGPEALADVAPGEPIVERLTRYFDDHGVGDGTFDRAVPASYLQRNRDAFADIVDMDTRKQFGSLSRTLNRTLGSDRRRRPERIRRRLPQFDIRSVRRRRLSVKRSEANVD